MKSTKTSLFLMELIIAILFFSLSAAVCVQLFVKSHIISQASVNENHAVMWAENFAETFSGCQGDYDTTLEALSTFGNIHNNADKSCSLYFDKDWNVIEEVPYYVATLTYREEDSMHIADIEIVQFDKSEQTALIYSLLVKKYCGLK